MTKVELDQEIAKKKFEKLSSDQVTFLAVLKSSSTTLTLSKLIVIFQNTGGNEALCKQVVQELEKATLIKLKTVLATNFFAMPASKDDPYICFTSIGKAVVSLL